MTLVRTLQKLCFVLTAVISLWLVDYLQRNGRVFEARCCIILFWPAQKGLGGFVRTSSNPPSLRACYDTTDISLKTPDPLSAFWGGSGNETSKSYIQICNITFLYYHLTYNACYLAHSCTGGDLPQAFSQFLYSMFRDGDVSLT